MDTITCFAHPAKAKVDRPGGGGPFPKSTGKFRQTRHMLDAAGCLRHRQGGVRHDRGRMTLDPRISIA